MPHSTTRLTEEEFMPPESLAENEIEFFALNVPRPGGQHVGMHIAPIVAVHRATGISVTVSDVERSQMATKEKAARRLAEVLERLRSSPPAVGLTAEDREALKWLRELAKDVRPFASTRTEQVISVLARLLDSKGEGTP